jgi:hypothetical protein
MRHAENEGGPYGASSRFVWLGGGCSAISTGYASPEALLTKDLGVDRPEAVSREPRSRIADGRLGAAANAVEVFGFHLRELDVRVHAETRPRRGDGRRLSTAARLQRHGDVRSSADRLDDTLGRDVLAARGPRRPARLSGVPLSRRYSDSRRARGARRPTAADARPTAGAR